MTTPTNWTLALAILGFGLIAGFAFVFFTRRKTARLSSDTDLRDLESKRDSLVQQLRELADSESPLTAEELDRERVRLEGETAAVLRQIDARGARVVERKTRPAPKAFSPRLAFVLGIVVTLALGGLVLLVMNFASGREPAPTASVAAPAAHPVPDQALQNLQASVQAEPENLEQRIELARAYLDRDNLMGVFEQTKYVLARTPDDSRALTYNALVHIGMGQSGEAKVLLQRALKNDPDFLEASVASAWIQVQEGRKDEAEKTLQATIVRHPEQKARIEEVRGRMMSHQNVEKNLPEGHPPLSAKAGVQKAGAQVVQVTIEMEAGKPLGNGIIYVVARPDGKSGAPAVLVKRVETDTLPITFDLSAADSMLGQTLPQKMRVEARLDSDGDAATKNPSDPFGARDGVVPGSSITLAMK